MARNSNTLELTVREESQGTRRKAKRKNTFAYLIFLTQFISQHFKTKHRARGRY